MMHDNEQHLKARTPQVCPWVSQTIDQVKHAITVGELKSLLNYYDSDMQVYLSFDRGYTYGTIDDSDISEYAYSEEFEEWKEVY